MKLLVDMNLTPRWIEFLAESGFSAQHWSNIGHAAAPDVEIMAHARREDFVGLTQDLDFGAILAATAGHKPSVIQIRAAEPSPENVGAVLISALTKLDDELEQGALVTIDPLRSRVRLLPLSTPGA